MSDSNPTYDIVIRNGMIIDGARNPRYKGDVGIKDGKIARMGRIPAGQGARELDAEGLVVAPGFIDLHTHYDAQVFWDPYLTTSGWNGVTSVVVGRPVAGQGLQAGHAHGDAHFHLLADHRAVDVVGHFAVDLDAPVHRPRMHDQGVGLGRRQLLPD